MIVFIITLLRVWLDFTYGTDKDIIYPYQLDYISLLF
nr:MAG TPA: hypothetical protein [Caudoviricetes sp.]